MTIVTSSHASHKLTVHQPHTTIPSRDEIRISNNPALRTELREERELCREESSPVSHFKGSIIADLLKTGVFRKTSIYVSPNTAVLDAYNNAYDAVQEIVTAHTAS